MMRKERFQFLSSGDALIGDLFFPDHPAKGVIVTSGPLTSVKEQASGAYARALANRGYIALAFDHRTFGESGGQPRQFENPDGKAEDIRAAFSALADDERTRRLPMFAVGVCAGAGYMALAVVDDRRVRAFAGIAGVYPDVAQTRTHLGDKFQIAIAHARAAEQRWRDSGEVEMIPAVGPGDGDVAMPLVEAYEYYGTSRGAVANYVNGFAVQSRAYTLPFDAQSLASSIRTPTVIVHSEKALMPALARDFFAALPGTKRQEWLKSKGQIDFYDDPHLIEPSAAAVDSFFLEQIKSMS
jgi:uncharacterized protein